MRWRARRRGTAEGGFPGGENSGFDGGGLQGGGDHVQGDHKRHIADTSALHRSDAGQGGEAAEKDRAGKG